MKRASSPLRATRLPSGLYAYRGKARSFSDIPKREQSRFRSIWAEKAAVTRAREAPPEVEGVRWRKPRGEHTKEPIPYVKVRKGADPGEAIERLSQAKHGQRASPVVTLKWADGTTTRASLRFEGNNKRNRKDAAEWVRAIERTGGENLRGDKGSKGKGRPKVTEISWLTGPRKRKRKKSRAKTAAGRDRFERKREEEREARMEAREANLRDEGAE